MSTNCTLPEVWVVTLLHVEDAVPFGQLSDVAPGKIHQRLRKHIERSELNGAVIMDGFEVKADDADQQWIPHSHLLIAGCGEAQLDSLCQQFTAKRASHRVPLTELAKQISYTPKVPELASSPTAIRQQSNRGAIGCGRQSTTSSWLGSRSTDQANCCSCSI